MLNSINAKIITLTFSLLCALGIIITSAAVIAFYNDKELIIEGNNASITAFEGQINTEIATLEKNALDLALMGEIYYQDGKQQKVGDFSTKEILRNYPNSMGNGIYFLPYKIYNNQKIACIHAVWTEKREIEMLYSCVDSTFDYFKQDWYSKIKNDLLNGQRVAWSKPYRSTQLGILMTTVGAGIYDQGELVGMATVDWELDTILDAIFKIKPTPHSFVLFGEKSSNSIIATTEPDVDNSTIMGEPLDKIKWYSEDLKEGVAFEYQGVKYMPYVKRLNNGLFLIVNVPLFELFHAAVYHLSILLSVLMICTLLIVSILFWVLRRNINEPISKLTGIAQRISQGDLEETIQLDNPSELAQLAAAFNKMKTDIKEQIIQLAKISNEKEKIQSELAIAKNIQTSALPTDFPKEECFELVATMTPAREVGGDFYDFFPIDDRHYAFVIADVSGKGITAALYMMSAKTVIKNMLQSGYSLEEAINRANNTLCDNQSGMFVTAFIGILDLNDGQVQYINAGHCPPLHKTQGGYEYIDMNRNIILGARLDYKYKSRKLTLQDSDRLFLYTDGVTEAQNHEGKMFEEERLKKALNQKEMPLADTLNHVYKQIKKFVKDDPQSDDITMLVLEFRHGKRN
ncbi:MAG: SpoIIE family protein phosphatase [Alphaproteobacteria bacterium]|nr:SpoIIE family protein phosphatase [Alphaproteobacteria bacterium]